MANLVCDSVLWSLLEYCLRLCLTSLVAIDTPQASTSNGRIETPFGASGVPTFGTEAPKPARKPGEFSPELEADLQMLKTESEKGKLRLSFLVAPKFESR